MDKSPIPAPVPPPPLPLQYFLTGGSDSAPDGIEYTALLEALGAGVGHELFGLFHPSSSFGVLDNFGGPNVYSDFSEVAPARPMKMCFANFNTVTTWTAPSAETITVNPEGGGGPPLILVQQADILIPPTTLSFYRKDFWVDVDGNLYLELEEDVGIGIVDGPYTFEEAVANGAV